MNTLIRFAIGLAALLPAISAAGDDLQVDVVVNLTDAGRKIVRPDKAHPAYYYPISKGYTPGGQVLNNQAAPPPDWNVLHTVAQALADQGYLVASKVHPPEMVLIFWWGYKAPAITDNSGVATQMNGAYFSFDSNQPGSHAGGGLGSGGFDSLTMSGGLMTNTMTNENEMDDLVMGSEYDADNTLQNIPNLRLERLRNAARDPRYYVMVSALNFDQALKKKFVVYWTARVSTPIYDHTLAEVIPTLIADLAPSFGRDTAPRITDRPLVPEGRVIVGTPIMVASRPASAR